MQEVESNGRISRRGIIGSVGALMAATATVTIANNLALSSVPREVILCWSGWRRQPTNSGMGAWYTAHLPVFAKHPSHESREARQHFISFVQRTYPENLYQPEPRVSGYWPGEDFLIFDCIQPEDSRDALRAWGRDGWERTLDRVFAAEKKRAADALIGYLKTLEVVAA